MNSVFIHTSLVKMVIKKKLCEFFIPSSWNLFKTIQSFLEPIYVVRQVRVHKPLRLLNVYFFLKNSIQEYTLDVYLIWLEFQIRRYGQEDPDGFQPCNRGKGFIKINVFYLGYPFVTSLALFLVTVPCSSCLFLKIHLVPMTFLSLGLLLRNHTSFLWN